MFHLFGSVRWRGAILHFSTAPPSSGWRFLNTWAVVGGYGMWNVMSFKKKEKKRLPYDIDQMFVWSLVSFNMEDGMQRTSSSCCTITVHVEHLQPMEMFLPSCGNDQNWPWCCELKRCTSWIQCRKSRKSSLAVFGYWLLFSKKLGKNRFWVIKLRKSQCQLIELNSLSSSCMFVKKCSKKIPHSCENIGLSLASIDIPQVILISHFCYKVFREKFKVRNVVWL